MDGRYDQAYGVGDTFLVRHLRRSPQLCTFKLHNFLEAAVIDVVSHIWSCLTF
jgi:hypothetical protein